MTATNLVGRRARHRHSSKNVVGEIVAVGYESDGGFKYLVLDDADGRTMSSHHSEWEMLPLDTKPSRGE